jgi:male germ cell-associated kinase
MDKYKIVKRLGEGAYGVVMKCINQETQEVVAIKRMKQKLTWPDALKLREVQALQKLTDHPNIVKIKEMSLKESQLNIIFEFCDKNLYQQM